MQFSKTWNIWKSWTMPSSTHPMTSIFAWKDFLPFSKMSKVKLHFHRSQFLTNFHKNSYIWSFDRATHKPSDYAQHTWWCDFIVCQTVQHSQLIKFEGKAAKQDVALYLSQTQLYWCETSCECLWTSPWPEFILLEWQLRSYSLLGPSSLLAAIFYVGPKPPQSL